VPPNNRLNGDRPQAGGALAGTLGTAMVTFRRITKRDLPLKVAALAEKHHALLVEALAIAQRKAKRKPQVVREILATATVEGLAKRLNAKAAAVSYRAEKHKRTWHRLIPWRNLEHTTATEEAESMISVVEDNVRMTEADSWPKSPTSQRQTKRKR